MIERVDGVGTWEAYTFVSRVSVLINFLSIYFWVLACGTILDITLTMMSFLSITVPEAKSLF